MKLGDVIFSTVVLAILTFFAYHNPFGFWKFWGLLLLGVGLAAVVSWTLLFIIKQGQNNDNGR